MDDVRARALLQAERARVEVLLGQTTGAAQEDRSSADEQGVDIADPASAFTDEERDDAIAEQLKDRLEAIARAERRLDEGTFGRSVRSGVPIPDDRLEADPAAELTAEEARES
jgi:DnaK suppressor protein